MKPLTAIAAAIVLAMTLGFVAFSARPAEAQNMREIDRARDGASCPHCNLFQADFSDLNLKSRDFAGARLRQADLSASVMNRTDFAGADLRDVNAYGAVFSDASFAGANLTNASFVGAYLEGADFRGARLAGVNFSGAEMQRARGLRQAQLERACGDGSTRLPPGLRLRRCD
ncbi:MAG TPA: pentapeptide repeat-containing protein [Caulobacteraceae bacterium]|nr:pentapeptide repeat-containing protein [Caulobacteraceae bacterium]